MRTIKELIGEERARLPKTVRDTSLFVKEIIERYGQGGRYKFDPASLVYLLPAAPEQEEEPKKRPEEERVREYLIRERDTQKLEIRESRGRDFVQRIVESVRLPGARELLRRQSVKQQLAVWLQKLIREYRTAEHEKIRELAEGVRQEKTQRELLENSEVRKILERLLSEQNSLRENYERISSEPKHMPEEREVQEEAPEAQTAEVLSGRQEELHQLLGVTEEALRLVYLHSQSTEEKEESRTELLTETLSYLEQAWTKLRQESLHVERLQSYHGELERLQNLVERWQRTQEAGQEEKRREEIRESLRRVQLQRELLEEYTLYTPQERREENSPVRPEQRNVAAVSSAAAAAAEGPEPDAGGAKAGAPQRETRTETKTETEIETETASLQELRSLYLQETASLIPEDQPRIGEARLEHRITDNTRTERTVQEIEEHIRSELRRKAGEAAESVRESAKETAEQKIVSLIVQELPILRLIGRMSEDTWNSFRSCLDGGEAFGISEEQRETKLYTVLEEQEKVLRTEGVKSMELAQQLLLSQTTAGELWKAESRVLEKHSLSEEERNSLELLERRMVYRTFPEHFSENSETEIRSTEKERRLRLSAQEWRRTVWEPYIEKLTAGEPLSGREKHRNQNDEQNGEAGKNGESQSPGDITGGQIERLLEQRRLFDRLDAERLRESIASPESLKSYVRQVYEQNIREARGQSRSGQGLDVRGQSGDGQGLDAGRQGGAQSAQGEQRGQKEQAQNRTESSLMINVRVLALLEERLRQLSAEKPEAPGGQEIQKEIRNVSRDTRREKRDVSQEREREGLPLPERAELVERRFLSRRAEEYAGGNAVRAGLTEAAAGENMEAAYRSRSLEEERRQLRYDEETRSGRLEEGRGQLRYRREPEEGRTEREQERFSYRTASAEREKTERRHNEQQRQLHTLQETARRQEEKLAVMEEEQKRLSEQLARAQEESETLEDDVIRRMQSQLRLERLRRGLV